MFEQKQFIVIWLCKTLTKKFSKQYFVKVYPEAVFNNDYGMLCDCGHWTFGQDSFHVPIRKDNREVYVK
jgi:hypothetical protein